ncbi:MAG: hypothetical protein ACREYE_08365 [Gammaproteobacteria bacterium]
MRNGIESYILTQLGEGIALTTLQRWRSKTITLRRKRMPAKKASKKASASTQSASQKGGTKKSNSKKASVAKTQIKKTAVKVLAGAAAGAVRAIIGPLEEAAATSEKASGLNKQGGNKGGRSTGKSGGKSSK